MNMQKVITRVESKVYYTNEVIPAGRVGYIGADKVDCVRLRKDCKCKTFICVDFEGNKRVALHEHEIVRVAPEVI